ncbi:SDR family NAD(P)-dependent oxidoreductase [Solirubrobacter taibaiensis]|nr:SDR family NAD(P)-dependent oxidoreductase [Solirubrobacter taibaiensis]
MTDKKTWIVTGAGRGMGTDIARAALAAGHNVVATGRNPDTVTAALGGAENLLVLALDVTDSEQIATAIGAAAEHFGSVDVLVNNAGNFYAGFFEELSEEQVEQQLATVLFGSMNMTRAVLPIMRSQRSGHIVAISSVAGLIGQSWCSAYAAAKFGLEGFMESLATEVGQFGITTTIVEPGFFRTELLTPDSMISAALSIDDYAAQTEQTDAAWRGMSGQQGGDPAKLARALVELSGSEQPPARWVAGADAIEAVEGKAHTLLAQVEAHREISSSLAFEA